MKKLFIGLLIIAAGAGVFYLLRNEKETSNNIQKELLTGEWKLDSMYARSKDSTVHVMIGMIHATDSNLTTYHYSFNKNGTILQSQPGTAKSDTSYYEWSKKNELLFKDAAKDSTGEIYTVNKLVTDSLVIQSKDSAVFVFKKLK